MGRSLPCVEAGSDGRLRSPSPEAEREDNNWDTLLIYIGVRETSLDAPTYSVQCTVPNARPDPARHDGSEMTADRAGVTRRSALRAFAGATGALGLAGCSGSSNGTDDGQEPSAGTTDGGDAGDTADGGSGCEKYSWGGLQPYDAGGSPLVFDFEYPDTWSESRSSGEVVRDQYTVIVQSDVIDERSSSEAVFDVVETLSYAGESIDVYRTPGYPNDGQVSLCWLPHGTSAGRRYFQTAIAFGYSSGFLEETADGYEYRCTSLARTAIDQVLPTLEPNPESTIESSGES